jgi:hypothetical protein
MFTKKIRWLFFLLLFLKNAPIIYAQSGQWVNDTPTDLSSFTAIDKLGDITYITSGSKITKIQGQVKTTFETGVTEQIEALSFLDENRACFITQQKVFKLTFAGAGWVSTQIPISIPTSNFSNFTDICVNRTTQEVWVTGNASGVSGFFPPLLKSTNAFSSSNPTFSGNLNTSWQNSLRKVVISSTGRVFILLGGTTGGIRYSDNGGSTWQTPSSYPAGIDIRMSDMSIAGNKIALAGDLLGPNSSNYPKIFISNDAGINFSEVNISNIGDSYLRSIDISSDGNTVVAGGQKNGGFGLILKSLNGGSSFYEAYSELSDGGGSQVIRGLSVINANNIYAITTSKLLKYCTPLASNFFITPDNLPIIPPQGVEGWVTVTSNSEVSLGSFPSWIENISFTNNVLHYRVKNNEGQYREATLTFHSGTETRSLLFRQDNPVINISPPSQNVPAKGLDELELTIQTTLTDYNYQVIPAADGTMLEVLSVDIPNGKIKLRVPANYSNLERDLKLKIYNSQGIESQFLAIQEAAYINITSTNPVVLPTHTPTEIDVNVATNMKIAYIDILNPEVLLVEPSSSNAFADGSHTLKFAINANNSGQTKTYEVRIGNAINFKVFTITQPSNAFLQVNTQGISIPRTSGTNSALQITTSPNLTYTLEKVPASANWFTIQGSLSRTGNSTVSVTYTSNPTLSNRQAGIRIVGSNGTIIGVVYSQAPMIATPPPTNVPDFCTSQGVNILRPPVDNQVDYPTRGLHFAWEPFKVNKPNLSVTYTLKIFNDVTNELVISIPNLTNNWVETNPLQVLPKSTKFRFELEVFVNGVKVTTSIPRRFTTLSASNTAVGSAFNILIYLNSTINGYYQCVEIIRQRYPNIFHGIKFSPMGNGDAYWNAPFGGTQFINGGTVAPKVGDILCYIDNHVAAIREVRDNEVYIFQQNVGSNITTHVRYRVPMTKSTINGVTTYTLANHLGLRVKGWRRLRPELITPLPSVINTLSPTIAYHNHKDALGYRFYLSVLGAGGCYEPVTAFFDAGQSYRSSNSSTITIPSGILQPNREYKLRMEVRLPNGVRMLDNSFGFIQSMPSYFKTSSTASPRIEEVENIKEGKNEKVEVVVFPNPIQENDKVFVQLENSDAEVINLSIVDMTGKIFVETKLVEMKDGKFEISTNDLKQGLYIIQIKTKNGLIFSKKLVIK